MINIYTKNQINILIQGAISLKGEMVQSLVGANTLEEVEGILDVIRDCEDLENSLGILFDKFPD